MRLLICFLTVITLASCKSEKQGVKISPKAELHFGNAGGMANARNEFIITADGKLYQQMNGGPRKLLTDIGEKKAISLMHDGLDLGLDKLDFKHPGNMTNFLIYNDGTKTNEVDWGDPQNTPSGDIKSFYEKLFELRP